MIILIRKQFKWFTEDYVDDNKCNEWTPEIPFENVSIIRKFELLIELNTCCILLNVLNCLLVFLFIYF